MPTFVFTNAAKDRFIALERRERDRILEKLRTLQTHDHLETVLRRLTNFAPATHRLRIGAYRIILEQKNQDTYWVLDIGHRRDVYR